MIKLSKVEIKDFAERFKTLKNNEETNQKQKVSLTFQQANKAIENFISFGRKDLKKLKPSFVYNRVNIIKLCLQNQTPLNRWDKIKKLLIDHIDSQIINLVNKDGKLTQYELKPSEIISNLISPNSPISLCIKLLVLFNITDDKIKLSDGIVVDWGFSDIENAFPRYNLIRRGVLLKAKTRTAEIIKKLLPLNEDTYALSLGKDLSNKFSTTYSILIYADTCKYINNNKFFDFIYKQKSSILRSYNISPNENPPNILNVFNNEVQKKLLQQFLGKSIIKFKWGESFSFLDVLKIAKEYFPDQCEEVDTIMSIEHNANWKPDNYLLNENSLRYELIDIYLNTLAPDEREKYLIKLSKEINDFSIFNLTTFRELVQKVGIK